MSLQSDADYYKRREQDERIAAEAATCPDAKLAHLQLADLYARMAHVPKPAQPLTGDDGGLPRIVILDSK